MTILKSLVMEEATPHRRLMRTEVLMEKAKSHGERPAFATATAPTLMRLQGESPDEGPEPSGRRGLGASCFCCFCCFCCFWNDATLHPSEMSSLAPETRKKEKLQHVHTKSGKKMAEIILP